MVHLPITMSAKEGGWTHLLRFVLRLVCGCKGLEMLCVCLTGTLALSDKVVASRECSFGLSLVKCSAAQ